MRVIQVTAWALALVAVSLATQDGPVMGELEQLTHAAWTGEVEDQEPPETFDLRKGEVQSP